MGKNSKKGAFISKKSFNDLLVNYKRSRTNFKTEKGEKLVAISFGKEKIETILNQKGCDGIRIYFGVEKKGRKSFNRLIIVGMDEEGNNQNQTSHKRLDRGYPCPDDCPDM